MASEMINNEELNNMIPKDRHSVFKKLSAEEIRNLHPSYVKVIEESGITVEEYLERVRTKKYQKNNNQKMNEQQMNDLVDKEVEKVKQRDKTDVLNKIKHAKPPKSGSRFEDVLKGYEEKYKYKYKRFVKDYRNSS